MWRRPGRSGAVLYALLAAFVGTLVALFTRVRVEVRRGHDRAAAALPDGAIIVISNHTSHLDGVLLALACRRMGRNLRLLATSGVFRAPLLGGVARRLGFIRVERGSTDAAAALGEAAEALGAGEAIGIYPEGRLTRDPNLWPERAKTGAVRLALRCDAPIVPVAMLGASDVLGRRKRVRTLLRNLVRRPKVSTRVGNSIDVRSLMHLAPGVEPTSEEVRHAADLVMARLIALVADLRGEVAPHPHGAPRVEA